MIRDCGACPEPVRLLRPSGARNDGRGISSGLLAMTLLCLFAGCIRFQGGAFYAKKGPEDEAPKVKEVYVDTNEFLPGKKSAPGKIEV